MVAAANTPKWPVSEQPSRTNAEFTSTVTDLVASSSPAAYHHPTGPPAPAITDTLALPCP